MKKAVTLIEPIIGGKIASANRPDCLVIAIDFDGTICHHPGQNFPAIGEPVPHALDVLKRIEQAGHKLMLWTMRDVDNRTMAEVYLRQNGLTLWASNYNPEQTWSMSRKAYAHIYIDDAALGCPLVQPADSRAYVDWFAVEVMLEELGVLAQPEVYEYAIDFALVGDDRAEQRITVVEIEEKAAIQWLRERHQYQTVIIRRINGEPYPEPIDGLHLDLAGELKEGGVVV